MSDSQKLIDIIFEVAQYSAKYYSSNEYNYETQRNHMEWVANQLRKCGYDTIPMGMSWGILVNGEQTS